MSLLLKTKKNYMAEENISCPFCGETIKSVAKKCRYCGEWLIVEAPSSIVASRFKEPSTAEILEVATVDENGQNAPSVNPLYPLEQSPENITIPNSGGQPAQTIQIAGGQHKIRI